MKRAFSLFTVICFIFLFSSCKKEVNMEYITEYQRNNFSAEIIIEQGKEKYSAEIENSGGTLYLRFTEPSGLSPFVFKRSDEVCLYIDKNSRLPIKALNDSTTVNIISFKRISE